MSKELAIAFGNSTNAAAAITAGLVEEGVTEVPEAIELFRALRDAIFADLKPYAEAVPAQQYNNSGGSKWAGGKKYGNSGGGNFPTPEPYNGPPEDYELPESFKKHAGKTLAQAYAEDSSYIEWIANKSKHSVAPAVAKAFLASQ